MGTEAQQIEAEEDDTLVVLPRSKDEQGQKHQKRAFQRRRRSRACDPCRQRKTKCDTPTTGPCSSCSSASILCKFSEETEDKRKIGPARRIRHLEANVQELTQKLQLAEEKLRLSRPTESVGSAQSVSSASSFNDNVASLERIKLESDSTEQSVYDQEQTEPRRRGSKHIVNQDGSFPLYYGPTSGLAFVNSVQDFMQGLGYKAPTKQVDTNLQIPNHSMYHKERADLDLRVYLPPRELGERLFEIYRNVIQRWMPFLYWPAAMSNFRAAYDQPILLSDETTVTGAFCFTMMVMAFATFSSDNDEAPAASDDPSKRGWHYYECARKYHDLNKERYHLHDVISMALMAIYLDGLALASPSWMMVGAMARVCQDIGLHLEHPSGMYTTIDMEVRTRIFWGCYCMDRKLALQFGRAPSFADEEVEAKLPGFYDMGGIENEFFDEKAPETLSYGLKIFRAMVHNARFNNSVLKLDRCLGGEDELIKKIKDIEFRMSKFENELPEDLTAPQNFAPLDPGALKFLFHPLWTRLSIYRFFTDSTTSHEFRTRCLVKSLLICDYTVHLLRRIIKFPNWEKSFRLHQSEMVYLHTFKVAMVLLLGSYLFNQQQVLGDVPGSITICIEALKEAAYSHKTPAKCLESFHEIAGILGFNVVPSPASHHDPATQPPPTQQKPLPPVQRYSEYTRPIYTPITTSSTYGGPTPTILSSPDPLTLGKTVPLSGQVLWTHMPIGGSSGTSPTDFTTQVAMNSVHWPEHVDGVEWGVFEGVLSNETPIPSNIISTQNLQVPKR